MRAWTVIPNGYWLSMALVCNDGDFFLPVATKSVLEERNARPVLSIWLENDRLLIWLQPAAQASGQSRSQH